MLHVVVHLAVFVPAEYPGGRVQQRDGGRAHRPVGDGPIGRRATPVHGGAGGGFRTLIVGEGWDASEFWERGR